jgi:hypothetical protein
MKKSLKVASVLMLLIGLGSFALVSLYSAQSWMEFRYPDKEFWDARYGAPLKTANRMASSLGKFNSMLWYNVASIEEETLLWGNIIEYDLSSSGQVKLEDGCTFFCQLFLYTGSNAVITQRTLYERLFT